VVGYRPLSQNLLARSRATAVRALAWSAGGFVLLLLASAPLRHEPAAVIWSYLGLLAVFGLVLRIQRTHPVLAGALSCLGPYGLVTGLVWLRGGMQSAPGVLAYMTLVVLAALCWGSVGAFVLCGLGSLAVAGFALSGLMAPGMGPLQVWAEVSFQLAAVSLIADLALRAVERATAQALRLEAEEHRTHLARLALEARVLESQSLEAVGRLAGGVAHDFNNLLTVILNGSEFLLRKPGLAPEVREDLCRIEDAATRASKLTQQLLAVGRKQVLSPVVLCPAQTVRDLQPLLQRLLPANTELALQISPETGNVLADEARLEQVLLNLVTNASHSVRGGGKITVSSCNLELAEPLVSGRSEVPAGSYVEVSVSDTGAGMSREVLERIFEPFFTTKELGQGTGLGLATVLGIVRQSGGFVRVESEVDVGSSFRVLLPRSLAASEKRRETVAEVNGNRARVLLVEDEAMVRMATRRVLESLGHIVVDASSAAEALEKTREGTAPFDLLISDVIMPGHSGPALAEQLWQKNPDLKVLFISGYPADELPLTGKLPARSQYLTKPFSRAGLGAKVADMLGTPSPPALEARGV
jgi:signal transduction histidine kinase/CheY-like chemotaxis protein